MDRDPFKPMRIIDQRVDPLELRLAFDAQPAVFRASSLARSLGWSTVPYAYQAAVRLIQRLRKAGMAEKLDVAGPGVQWRKTNQSDGS